MASLLDVATTTSNTLWAGTGNPATGFETVGGADLQLALAARPKGVGTSYNTDASGHFIAPAADNSVRFAYSVASETYSLGEFNVKLHLDLNAGAATNFKTFILTPDTFAGNSGFSWVFDQSKNGILEQAELDALGVAPGAGAYIRDDSGNSTSLGHVTQNIENISWFDGDGDAFDTLAKGSYTVTLEAQSKGGQAHSTNLTNSIVIDVAGGALSGAQSATDTLLAGATVGGAGATLLAGTGNSADGFQTVEVKDAGGSTLQLGLTARAGKVGQGQTFATTDNVHYAVPTATTDTRFAYSIASDGIDLKDVDLKLKIDVDSSSATSFKTFSRSNAGEWVLDSDPAIKITDDAGNPKVTQNIENIAWFDNVAGDVLAKGSYDVVLQAFDKGGLIPVIENRIVLDVDGGAPTGGGGTTTPPVVPVDPIDPTPDNDFNEAAASSSVFSFFAGEAPTPEKQAELEAFANMQYEAYAAMGVANPALGPYEALGLGFSETAEFIEKYGAQTESDFISSNYTAVFGHDATPEQLAHFQAQIDYFESLYETNGQSSNMADLHAKGAALGQMLGHAALSQFDMV